MKTLNGMEAVEYARKNAKALSKYADPIEEVCREDPNLIYVVVE
jgi:hypothetical protein